MRRRRGGGGVVRQDDPKTYPIEEILRLIREASAAEGRTYRHGQLKSMAILDGEEIAVTNRLRTYLKGTDCVACGAKGAYFRKTRQSDQPRPHLNLYAIKNNSEVLMTSDHIVPRSKGGADKVENLQPMCAKCNRTKADSMPEGSDG